VAVEETMEDRLMIGGEGRSRLHTSFLFLYLYFTWRGRL